MTTKGNKKNAPLMRPMGSGASVRVNTPINALGNSGLSLRVNSPVSTINLNNPMGFMRDVFGIYELLIDPENDRVRRLPAAEVLGVGMDKFRFLCNATARYFWPTVEVLDWLTEQIGGRTAIEIAAGQGDLGFHLGIPMSDSYIQQTPGFKKLAALHGPLVVPTDPPADVEKLECLAAVRKYQPQVVVAAWLTERYDERKHKTASAKAFIEGADEEEILRSGIETYILIGNRRSHGEKSILQYPHEEFVLDGHVSRSADQEANVIYVWHAKDL